MGGGQTSPADLRPRRGKGVSGPRSTAGGERGPWIGPDMRKRMNRDMEINGENVNDKVRYADLGLSPELMRAIDKKGYVQATPVQAGAIPYFMEWKDVIAKAPTGTGKTFAFGIPMVEHIDPETPRSRPWCWPPPGSWPSRSRTSCGTCAPLRRGCGPSCLYGGQPIDKQITPAEKEPPDRGGHPRPPDGPHEAAHRPAGQGADRGAGRGRPDAGHGLCPGRDPHPGQDAQAARTWACSPPPSPGR